MNLNHSGTNLFAPQHSDENTENKHENNENKPMVDFGAAAVASEAVTAAPVAPLASAAPVESQDELRPAPVVKVLSPVGVEYVFLTLSLISGAIALAAVLIALVNGKTDFSVLAFPVSVLLVTVPVFSVIFLHLKRLETANPALRLDPSKRRSTQFTQIAAFFACMFALIGFVFDIFTKLGGQTGPSIVKAGLDALCILVVAGGILAYYWRDEHKRWF
ncbi:MAG TPA: hypothetical protein VLG47_04735 [Candidatus Saccharimonadales bacterium]|nr:hypothetical protein [Candidatus Saccharimonadales bacterium]